MSLGCIPFPSCVAPAKEGANCTSFWFITGVLKKLFAVSTAGSLHTEPRPSLPESPAVFAEITHLPELQLCVASGPQPIPRFLPASKETRAAWMAAASACPSSSSRVSGSPNSCHHCLCCAFLLPSVLSIRVTGWQPHVITSDWA